MKLIITESQAQFLKEDLKTHVKTVAGDKLKKASEWGSGKASDLVTKVGPDVSDWAMKQKTGGNDLAGGIELSPEMAARFDDVDIERDAPNLHKFLQALQNPTAAMGAADQFKTPDIGLSLKDMIHPLGKRAKIDSPFGERISPTAGASTNHSGVDLDAASGTPIYAPLDGVILRAEDTTPNGCGGHIRIKHNKVMDTKFCHLKNWKVKKGDKVKKGEVIGYTGGGKDDRYRGVSTGPHLHYAIVVNGKHVNPVGIQPGLA